MYIHRRTELRRQWELSSRPPHTHEPEAEYTVNGYSTGMLVCAVCGETVGTKRRDTATQTIPRRNNVDPR